jgi:hypothetical protein
MSMALPAGMDAVASSHGSSGGYRALSTPRTMKTIPRTAIISPATGQSIARQGRIVARPVCSPADAVTASLAFPPPGPHAVDAHPGASVRL